MEIFNNSEHSSYEEIVSYGPKWWTEYREMDAVYRYQGWLLDLIIYFMEQVIKNQYPLQADEKALVDYEKLLKIEHDIEMSLEERRRIVSAYYSGAGHLSQSVILALVKAYTGQDGEVYWRDGTLCIEFSNNDCTFVSIGKLQKVIKRRIPAHIPFQTRCTCDVSLGIHSQIEIWKKRFTQAGTKPKISTGLVLAEDNIMVEAEGVVYKLQYPKTSEIIKTGIYHKTSTGLAVSEDDIELSTEINAYKINFPQADESVETGLLPKLSTGLAISNILLEAETETDAYGIKSENTGMNPSISIGLKGTGESVGPEVDVDTESWTVSYQICGDDLFDY